MQTTCPLARSTQRFVPALAMLMVLCATNAQGQQQSGADPSFRRVLAGSFVGGAAGVLVGGTVGGFIGGNRCSSPGNPDSCDLIRGIAVGIVVGSTLGPPVGAHLFNRRQGSLAWSLVASAAIATAGGFAIDAADRNQSGSQRTTTLNAIIVGVPLLQVVTSAIVEYRTARR
jgi:hypothetical protein